MTLDVPLLAKINGDRALGCEMLFAGRHGVASPPWHVTIVDLWRCADPRVLIEVYRGGGKTTKAEEFLALEGAFGNFWYTMLISETYSKACQRLEAIDYECRTNEGLKRLFGGSVLARKSIENRIFFKHGGILEAWGWEQEFQSLKWHDKRPDRAYLDDVENQERVRDAAAVDAGMQKLHLELMPAMDPVNRKIRFTQARRAEDCMVVRLSKNPDWLYFSMPVCDRDPDDPGAKSHWPERHPMQWIRNEKRVYQSAGMYSAFLQEYMLQAVNPETRSFKDEMLGVMDESPWHWMPRFAIYDPSRTSRRERNGPNEQQSARTGKVVVSRMGSKILVHESRGEYWQPDEFMRDVFETYEKHSPVKIGIEKTSLDDWLLQPMRLEMMRRGTTLPLIGMNAPQDRNKDEFIRGLLPFAQARDIVLVGGRGMHPQLVAEWCNFPNGPRDVMNALAYAMRIFAGIPVYEDFSGANIGDAPKPERGEPVFVGFNASPSECVAVCVIREGRRLHVAGDFAHAGAIADAVKTLCFEVRTSFPMADIQAWVPADTFDQWARIPIVPALRTQRLNPLRAEHAAVARGVLAERIRTPWRNARLLVVDKRACLTLNAIGAGYAFPVERGGRALQEPEPGTSRLIGEALECLVATLDQTSQLAETFPKGANVELNPSGNAFISANPRARA
jgi:hypothetical protein